MSKVLADIYLYRKYTKYEKMLIDAIMTGETVDKGIDSFQSIVYAVKQRQVTNALAKVLVSPQIILIIPEKPLPKNFKVFAAKDIKGDRKLKVFIDCSGIIMKDPKTGSYAFNNIDMLISHLVNAMTNIVYYTDEKRILMNNALSTLGADAFSKLFCFVLNHLFKISSIPGMKEKAIYLSSLYYLINVEGMDFGSDSARGISKKLAGISNREEEMIRYRIDEDSLSNIKEFIELVSDTLKLSKLTLETFLEKWMYLYGVGTVFALEMYPAFSAMMTDAYIGAYLNNQKTIEKVTDRVMVEYSKTIIDIGNNAF